MSRPTSRARIHATRATTVGEPAAELAALRVLARPWGRRPRGFALVAALLLTLVLALAVLSGDIMMQSARATPLSTRQASRVDAAAASALGRALDAWPSSARALAIGQSATLAYAVGGTSVTVVVTREADRAYRLDATAQGPNAAVTRTLRADALHLAPYWPEPVVATGAVTISGGTISAADTLAGLAADCETWNGNPAWRTAGGTMPPNFYTNQAPALRVPDSTKITQVPPPTVKGNGVAPVGLDPSVTAAVLTQLGDYTVDELVNAANVVLPPGSSVSPTSYAHLTTTAGRADTSCTGWGSPVNGGVTSGGYDGALGGDLCAQYRPVVYAQGAVTMAGGTAQGVLVADGPVVLSGGRFYGLIIVRRGTLTLNGATVYGQVLLLDPAGGLTMTAGTIQRSYCAVRAAADSRFLGRPVPRIGIADLVFGREVH